MKKRNQIDSALLNDILRVTNQAKPQTILSTQSAIDEFHRFNMAKGLSEWTISSYAMRAWGKQIYGSKQYEERLAKRKKVFIRIIFHMEA
ncbi:hypothetical protein [Sporosarcina psychrophila]|uniref:hypothetical protein n=1 Tax=Sporosarcina psychrophila TaxID=1476 RepID=UPI00078D7E4C|nr:hypothetical protein [Sporosarcina psychrophila]AMQ05201.1 hypothetical protein AZE41_04180 [Sporosarcina psychrophila]